MVSKTRQLTEGAMMVALIGIFLILNRQLANTLEGVISWVLSFPMMLYCAKYGVKVSLVPFVASLLLGLIIAAPTSIFYLFSAITVGVVYGYGVRSKWNNQVLLGITVVMEMFVLFVTVILLAKIFGYDIQGELSQLIQMIQKVSDVSNVENMAVLLLVIVYVGSSVLQAIVIHVASHELLKRLNIAHRPMKSVFDIQLPKWVSYLLVLVWVIHTFQGFQIYSEPITTYVLVLYSIGFLIGLSDGLITILCWLIIKNKAKYGMLIFLLCFIPIVNNLVFILGVYDIHSQLRLQLKKG